MLGGMHTLTVRIIEPNPIARKLQTHGVSSRRFQESLAQEAGSRTMDPGAWIEDIWFPDPWPWVQTLPPRSRSSGHRHAIWIQDPGLECTDMRSESKIQDLRSQVCHLRILCKMQNSRCAFWEKTLATEAWFEKTWDCGYGRIQIKVRSEMLIFRVLVLSNKQKRNF